MPAKCETCSSSFEVRDEDLKFYKSISPFLAGKTYEIPAPRECPTCRRQRRLAFRNERNFYRGRSDASGESILSLYSPDKLYRVYSQKEWWSDSWDALQMGRQYDPEQSFFDQFDSFHRLVPTMSLVIVNCENCDFTNNLTNSKNCYLVVDSQDCEDVFYSSASIKLKDCMDVWWSNTVELSAYIFCSEKLFNCFYCTRCANSNDLKFCRDCIHCSDCFGCTNLSHQQYCIYNKQYSKEDYEKHIKSFNLGKYSEIQNVLNEVEEFHLTQPYKAITSEFVENCTGDVMYYSRDCHDTFTINNCEGCSYLFEAGRSKQCQDISFVYDCEQGGVYQAIDSIFCFNSAFLVNCSNCSDSYYLVECYHAKNCFGCMGLRNKEYCIFNTQYTKEEYENIVSKIIEQMSASGEWGQFFSYSLSPFGYNETDASYFFPLEKEEALSRGMKWSDYEAPMPQALAVVKSSQLHDDIKEVPNSIVDWAIECETTGKLFRIATPELEFYRKNNIPLPRYHPEYRYLEMLKHRNPQVIYQRECMKCSNTTDTTFAPDRPEIIYCDDCYKEEFRG